MGKEYSIPYGADEQRSQSNPLSDALVSSSKKSYGEPSGGTSGDLKLTPINCNIGQAHTGMVTGSGGGSKAAGLK